MSLSPHDLRQRHFSQDFRNLQAQKRIAEWAGVELAALEKWSFAGSANMKAARQLIDYPPFARVKAGKVHTLLKALIHSAVNGNNESITDFKAAVDAELGVEGLARLDRWKHVQELGDYCVNATYYVRDARKSAERNDLQTEREKLHSLERELMAIGQQLRRDADKLAARRAK